MVPNIYQQRLGEFRRVMQDNGVHACLILSADPHLSEYLPQYWMIRKWLTGFTGSVGTVVVTQDHAHLWVDSRYWVQAERELQGTGYELQRMQAVGQSSYVDWLASHLPPGAVLAVDGRTLSLAMHEQLQQALNVQGGAARIRLDLDLPGLLWSDRPALPASPIFELSPEIACRSRATKLAAIRNEMQGRKATHHLLSTLDDIAWTLNLRASDVQFNPVFMAHLLIDHEKAQLFVDESRIAPEIRQSLADDGVQLQPYDAARDALGALGPEARLLLDPRRVVCALLGNCQAQRIGASNPSTLLKACKTPQEIANWREIMRRDGAALCEFFAWLDKAIEARESVPLDELMIDTELTARRQGKPGFVSRSFATIAAFQANAAMPHYRATQSSHARIIGDGLLLIDSGAQYQGGTTDITRMVPVGAVTDQQKADCTAVLKAMIAMSRLVFPEGIAAPLIDAVARAPLWERQLDYGHGTGHGVGYFLNVHEGPQVLAYRAAIHPDMAMRPGMVTSNEPGLYRPGKWGVRIENLVCCQPAGENEFGRFLAFETLTLCPIDTRCFQLAMLREDEIDWLNQYHQHVRDQISPLLSGYALRWLIERTEPVGVGGK